MEKDTTKNPYIPTPDKYEDMSPEQKSAVDKTHEIAQAMLDGLNKAKENGEDIY